VTTPEPDTIAELIDDCTDIPAGLRTGRQELPAPRSVTSWTVDEACLDQVRELDEYV
jgi:hypothetical protein